MSALLWTSLDTWIVAAGVVSACSCSLLGNFLVLRKMSMMGDAISHAVLPGLAAAFLFTASRSSIPMFVGAALVGVLTAVFTYWISHFGKVDEGASMGVVFTGLFAIGLIMIVQVADTVDLDPGCVLYGAIELTPLDTRKIAGVEIPRAVIVGLVVLLINIIFVGTFFKELKLTSFDPALATTMGINAQWMHYTLMTLVAITTVASFESVGSILVIAMLIVPPATAYLLTNRLYSMVIISFLIAIFCAVLGHVAAITVPRWWGFADTSTAGSMAVMSGLIFFLVMLLAPSQGIFSQFIHQRLIRIDNIKKDILYLLYQRETASVSEGMNNKMILNRVAPPYVLSRLVLWYLMITRKITSRKGIVVLTSKGREITEK